MRGRSKQCCFLCLWALFYALIHCWQYHYFQFSIHRLRCQQENKKNETTNKWIKFCISNRAIVLVYGFACKRKLFTLPSVYTYTPWFKLFFFSYNICCLSTGYSSMFHCISMQMLITTKNENYSWIQLIYHIHA